ncbi:MAG: ABC transporter ATP-binding protein [Bacteroidia bacterium]
MSNVLETFDLTKKYGRVTAVSNLSFSIKQGQVFGILGPNGSGKTTTLGILSGVTNATSGNFEWFGQTGGHEIRQKQGIILERPNFYPYMSAYKNLKVVAAIKSISNADERINSVLKQVGLFERRNDRFKTYSLGMKQRLSIGSALLSNPKVLVLDEPTNGLDPQGIAEIRELIIQIAKEGKTIVLASHLLDEVQKVCTDFMILSKGKLMHQGPVAEVIGETQKVELASENEEDLNKALDQIDFVAHKSFENGVFKVVLTDSGTAAELNSILNNQGIALNHLVKVKQSLEQKFLEILKQND